MSLGIIIQARIGSKRLPQKMILPFFQGFGILETILERLINEKLNVPIVLATSNMIEDDIIEEIGFKNNIKTFRGSEENVLDRFIKASEKYGFTKVIRICADNPFLDLTALKYQLNEFRNFNIDYWAYALSNNIPTIKTHYGFWTEGVTLSALKKIANKTTDNFFLEHVTNYIYTNPSQFSIHFEFIKEAIEKEKNIRLTIDTEEDFRLGQKIFNQLIELNIPFTALDILEYIKKKPVFFEIMKNEILKNRK